MKDSLSTFRTISQNFVIFLFSSSQRIKIGKKEQFYRILHIRFYEAEFYRTRFGFHNPDTVHQIPRGAAREKKIVAPPPFIAVSTHSMLLSARTIVPVIVT